MANDENTRLALLEEKFRRLAEDVGMMKDDQSKANEWITAHKMEEITRHNNVINAISAVAGSVEEIKTKGKNRLAAGDRLALWVPSILALLGFLGFKLFGGS
jgi:hypothetical protein